MNGSFTGPFSGAPPGSASEIHEGTILAGKYRVERILGTGGMGMVVAAHHIQLDERVALKFLLPEAVANMESVARFMREARSAFKIKSEHVARVTDVGQLESGAPYIVMEYLEGKDLAAWLTEYGPLPIPQAVDFILQACEAIAEAHAIGIVHRDLKPANLFCVQRPDGQPCIKVLDFGISKVMSQTAQMHAMTRTNGLVGSPLYMSPEHMKSSRGVDSRTDVWSLGVILYQLIAGQPPFDGEAVTELVLKVATEAPIPLRSYCPSAPDGLERVLARALEKDRESRYQTVGDLAIGLARFASPQARASVDRIVGTLEMAGSSKVFAAPILSQSGTSLPAFTGGPGTLNGPASFAPSAFPLPDSRPSSQSGPLPQPHVHSPHTLASWNEAAPGAAPAHKPNRKALGVTLAIAAGAVSVLGFLAYLNLKAAPAPETSWSSVGDPPSAPPAARPEAPPPPPVIPTTGATSAAPPLPPAPPSPASTAPSPAAVASAVVPPSTTGASTAGVVAPPPRPPAPSHRSDCNPPYRVQANGTHVFKPQCL